MLRCKKCRISISAFFMHLMLLFAAATISANAFADPLIDNPSSSSTLSGSAQTFNWSSNDSGTNVESWWLYVGTSKGASDIANSEDLGSNTEYNVIGIPQDGSTVHARLWYFSSDKWAYVDSTYTAATSDVVPSTPAITSPANNSELAGASSTFEWQDNNTPVNYWWLYVGSSKGARDIYDSGQSVRASTSVTVDGIPVDGSTTYVRLWFRTSANGWQSVDTEYQTGSSPDTGSDAAKNLAMIKSNATRSKLMDNNEFYNVPAKDISVSDLTLNYDAYNEGLLDTSNSGYFRVKCEPSHFAYDDPIVFPNQPGRAHLHMFFGNTDANAYSTFDSLLNSGTGTCNGEDLNRTAYWVPAMLDNQGNALIPDQIMVYYKNDNFRLNGANELVSPFPDNLKMISGNPSSETPQNGYSGDWRAQPIVSFTCGPAYGSDDRRQGLIPDCYGNDQLEMQIAFPQCVNEAAGYQPDQSHISYSENGYYGVACPASHPTDVSSIMYRIFFRPDQYGGALTDLHLSSDVKADKILPGGTTAHADWFGAWHPEAMEMWIENCNNTQADCETGLLDRDPAMSLKPRKRGGYPAGYRAPATELIKLCPGKTFNADKPLQSVANCHAHAAHAH